MSIFRTELDIVENPNKIKYDSKIFAIGSGFSRIMAEPLLKYKFNVELNPYGTIYNPLSIFRLLDLSINNRPIDESLITEYDGYWNHFDFHFKVKSKSKEKLQQRLVNTISETHAYLEKTDFIIITLGSAFVYKLNQNKHLVANCHKVPATSFDKVLLTSGDIVEGFRKIYKSLSTVKDIILVVSPVMHTKDSITLNSVSKSVLRHACHLIMSEFPYVKYFPAYELLLNDLRDYRFYEKDLLHPNEMAIDYIFSKFAGAYLDEESRTCINEVSNIIEAVDHVPYNPQNESYQKFLAEAIERINALEGKMDLGTLREELERKLL